MTKVKVKESFRYEGEEYEKNDVVDLPESVANSVKEKGYATEPDEEPDEIEMTKEEPVVEKTEGTKPDWDQLEEYRKQSGNLPDKWNPSQDSPKEPEVNPLRGVVTRKGEGPNGPFIVVEEKDGEENFTVWQHTALRALINSVRPGDKVSIKFEGEDTNPRGQTYLNYTAGAMTSDGERRILEEPED
jgi:hypothetical protein